MQTSSSLSTNKHSALKFTSQKTDTNCSFKEMSKSKRMLITRRNETTRFPTHLINESTCNKLQFKSIASLPRILSQILPDFILIQGFFQCQFQSQLLYRASDHNFSVKKFHEICDDTPNTLVICKTNHSQIIGGFTPLKWKCEYDETKTYFKSDHSQETFLFSVTNKQKYPIKDSNRNKAICCFQKFGPTFGGGYDLCIGDYADIDASCVSFFPNNFKVNRKITQNERLNFVGTSNENFKLKEWEVFELKFKDKKSQNLLFRDWSDIKIKELEEEKIRRVKESGMKRFINKIIKFLTQ